MKILISALIFGITCICVDGICRADDPWQAVQKETTPVFGSPTALTVGQREALSRVLLGHRRLQGETLRVAIVPELPPKVEPREAARRVLENWDHHGGVIQTRQAVLLLVTGDGDAAVSATVDLQDRLTEDAATEVAEKAAGALRAGGAAAGARAGVEGLLRALESPVLEQSQFSADFEQLIPAARVAAASDGRWMRRAGIFVL
ncbi:MAG TPA: TPM domain-containing protein, partial [Bdellovibrionota bacterium]|nr:TPM domain-containing protein [Bdellovibrionota bacterium]